jgi:hypothetical protein
MAAKDWTKHDKWTPSSGPWYRHASGKVAVSGGWGTIGDNIRGWRKTRFYDVVIINADGTTSRGRSCRSAKVAKDAAEKILASNG